MYHHDLHHLQGDRQHQVDDSGVLVAGRDGNPGGIRGGTDMEDSHRCPGLSPFLETSRGHLRGPLGMKQPLIVQTPLHPPVKKKRAREGGDLDDYESAKAADQDKSSPVR